MGIAKTLVLSFSFPQVLTWGSAQDKSRREYIRQLVATKFPLSNVQNAEWWEVNIRVCRMTGQRALDLDNVPKIIIDSFSKRQIMDDQSNWQTVGIWPNDCLPYIKAVTVTGDIGARDQTEVEVVACTLQK